MTTKKTRPSKRNDIPASFFLDQKNKKFPYKEHVGPNRGCIRCDLLQGAIRRARLLGRSVIRAKAQSLFDAKCGK